MHAFTYRTESETLHIHLSQGNPAASSCIVSSLNLCPFASMTEVEHIECVDVHARVAIDIGDREQILHLFDVESGLLFNLADDCSG